MILTKSLTGVAAALLIGAAIAPASAQSAHPTADKVDDPHAPAVGQGTIMPRQAAAAAGSVTTTVGKWSYMHVYSCKAYKSGSTHYLRANGTSGEAIQIYTSVAVAQAAIASACSNGNWIAFYVVSKSGSSFSWSDLQAWSYK